MAIAPQSKTTKKLKKKIKRVKKTTGAKTTEAAVKAKKMAVGEAPKTETPDRVTTETVAEHRKEVLSASQRFIYPLTHSKRRVATISVLIFVLMLGVLFGVTSLMLYRYQRTDDFAFRISQIIPFPVSRVDGDFVSYEDYLFEVRQNVHFYATQENINFEDAEGQAIMANIKAEALQRVKENAIALRLAKENGITVTPEEVSEQITLIREQGGIGTSDEALENTLNQYYNWTITDFESVIELQLLKQKLISVIDSDAIARITSVKNQLNQGAKFADLAESESDDPFSRETGGQLGSISPGNTDFPPVFVEAAFALEKDQISDVVQSSVGLHVILHQGVDKEDEEKIKISHILVQFKDISELLRDEISSVSVSDYITFDTPQETDGVIESQPQVEDQR